jgi:hypothetical protein
MMRQFFGKTRQQTTGLREPLDRQGAFATHPHRWMIRRDFCHYLDLIAS